MNEIKFSPSAAQALRRELSPGAQFFLDPPSRTAAALARFSQAIGESERQTCIAIDEHIRDIQEFTRRLVLIDAHGAHNLDHLLAGEVQP